MLPPPGCGAGGGRDVFLLPYFYFSSLFLPISIYSVKISKICGQLRVPTRRKLGKWQVSCGHCQFCSASGDEAPHPPVHLVLSKISVELFWAVVFLSPPLTVLVHEKQDVFCQSISVLDSSLASEQNCPQSCHPKPNCGQASWTGLSASDLSSSLSSPFHFIPCPQSAFVSPSHTLLSFTIRRAHPNVHLAIKHVL